MSHEYLACSFIFNGIYFSCIRLNTALNSSYCAPHICLPIVLLILFPVLIPALQYQISSIEQTFVVIMASIIILKYILLWSLLQEYFPVVLGIEDFVYEEVGIDCLRTEKAKNKVSLKLLPRLSLVTELIVSSSRTSTHSQTMSV